MNSTTPILLSVIIPTRNHVQLLSDLLDTLVTQVPVHFRWEVIVIDNGSTDQTAKLTKEKISSLPIEIRYIYEPKQGLHYGRHRGASEARGRYLAYLDDDVLLTPTWILGLEKIISGQAETVVGPILPKWESQPPAWLIKLTSQPGYLSLLNLGTEGIYIDPKFVYGGNFFIPKHFIFQLKGFHPDGMPVDQLRYRGDGEYALMMKFKEAGLRAWYDPIATVYHRIPRTRMNLNYLCKSGYAQGVSDSFTETRSKHYPNPFLEDIRINHQELTPKTIQYYMRRLRDLSLRQILFKLFSNLATQIITIVPLSQQNIKARIRKAYWEGYEYHQNEVRKDPELLKWVLQEDYWKHKQGKNPS